MLDPARRYRDGQGLLNARIAGRPLVRWPDGQTMPARVNGMPLLPSGMVRTPSTW